MSFCEHCEGQRFDRARVLRALREIRKQMRTSELGACDDVLKRALQAVQDLDIPHMELLDIGDDIVH